MLTVNDLKNLIANSGFIPLTIPELQTMLERLAGVIRNMPLRQEAKNALIVQIERAELALDTGLYVQSMLLSVSVQTTLISLVISGGLSATTAASAINLASLTVEAISYLIPQSNVS